ncbi:hypothetical protein T07_4015 [Trichinella nelsoni]|uniref:Uncharacterized protein n=1 Tax=Trichinella nelsoni TaxID=6336 RepID=A0A0V0S4B0_9BILA|nr:hypothetical protein T07_4015 [Trichinella nelsoni]
MSGHGNANGNQKYSSTTRKLDKSWSSFGFLPLYMANFCFLRSGPYGLLRDDTYCYCDVLYLYATTESG